MTEYHASETIERTFAAPLELVWELWTTPAGIGSWLGPNGFSATVEALELRTGGAFHYRMQAVSERHKAWLSGQGRPDSWLVRGSFAEVTPQTRLVFISSDEMAAVVMRHTVELSETADGVHMRFTIEAERAELLRGAAMGWRVSVEQMAAQLETRS